MFYCPYYNMTHSFYRARQANSIIRFFHASPNSPAVDIYVNGNLIAQNLVYKAFTPYITVPAGNYNIKVYPSGEVANPIIATNAHIPENTAFNIALIGTKPNITLLQIPEPITAQNFGRPCIRFIHLSPNTPAVDVKLSDGTKVFDNVGYKGATNYACIPSGTYTFTVSPTGTDNVILTIPDIKLDSNNYYTIYAIGQVGKTPALEAIVVSELR